MRGGSDTYRRVLEELKDLFGPVLGPAVEAYGCLLAERICEDDKGFFSAVEHRFEEGQAHDYFRWGGRAALPWSQRKAQLRITVHRLTPMAGPRPFASRSWSATPGRVAS
jgi:hypothetical protein